MAPLFVRALTLAALSVASSRAAYCGGAPDPNAQPNAYPIEKGAPVFSHSVANGHAFVAGPPGAEFRVMHLYGSAYVRARRGARGPRGGARAAAPPASSLPPSCSHRCFRARARSARSQEMGFAHGALYPADAREMLNRTWNYMVEQVEEGLAFLPTWLTEIIGNVALDVALDVLIDLTTPSTGPYIYEELHGLADGAGLDYKMLARVHLIGELTQGDCSLIGAWGAATAGSKTLQLRALDWDTSGPFRDYPAMFVYHPTTPGAHDFVTVGMLGFIGAFTGQSSAQMGVSEIGVSFPDTTYFGNESFSGVPFVFALRDILEFDRSYADSVARLQNANRTCDLILAVADGKAQTARSFAVSASEIFVFDDTNLQPWNNSANTWHPRFKNMVWHAMDWLCPGASLASDLFFWRRRGFVDYASPPHLCDPLPPCSLIQATPSPWRRS